MAETVSPNHRHTPIRPTFRKCPVCHQRVFSAAGIHPQCAVEQQEAELKAEQKLIRQEAERAARDEALLGEG